MIRIRFLSTFDSCTTTEMGNIFFCTKYSFIIRPIKMNHLNFKTKTTNVLERKKLSKKMSTDFISSSNKRRQNFEIFNHLHYPACDGLQ